MKKFAFLFAMILGVLVFTGCPKEPVIENGVAISKIVAATSDLYAAWEEDRTIPATVTVDGQQLQVADYVYLGASALVAISEGSKDDIPLKSVNAASNPDRDSYDKDEIAVKNGPKDGKNVTEDIVTVAKNLIKAADEKGQLPNQTNFFRGTDAVAFSTNRAIVTIARTLAEYAKNGQLPATVSTEYLGGGLSLKAFAIEFVKYLDVWETTIADKLSADGSACEDNGNPWERVHFIPIPQDTRNDWTNQGEQWDPKYGPYKTVEIEGTTYTAAQCWEIAIRGLMNLCTTTGEAFLNEHSRNGNIPYGNGKSLSAAPISNPSAACVWGKYPWYESKNDGGAVKYNGQPITEVGLEFIMKCTSWHVVRSFIENANNSPLGMIGNFQQFGTGSSTLNLEGYDGLICPMREFLILARFYKYMLDNNIDKNVYDALKDVKVDFELYNQELPIILKTESLTFEADETTAKNLEFTATENWTAATEAGWIHLNPESGAAGEKTIAVTVDATTSLEGRSGVITLTAGTYTKDVTVKQNAYVPPVTGTIKDFAKEFVKLLPVWEATVGTVDADGNHNGAKAWKNVHFLPIYVASPGYTNAGNQYDEKWKPYWSAKVGETEYSSNQCWEIAFRALINMCTSEGEAFLPTMDDRNKAFTAADGVGMDANMPTYSAANKWGGNPWYETDGAVTYNGQPVDSVGIDFMLKVGCWHVVRSFVKTDGNNPLGNIGNFQEFGTSTSTLNLTGYAGQIAPMRELIVLARIFKYLLDNNIESNVYTALQGVNFDYDMYHQVPSIKEFAQAFVGCLDVWQNTVGTVDADGTHNGATAWTNVHFLPIYNSAPGYTNEGNQYDPKYKPYWSAKIGKNEYSSNQCWEMAIRGLMDLCTTEGDEFLPGMTDRNKAYTLGNGVGMDAPIPSASSNNKWNANPWYEYDNTVTYNGAAITEVGIEFLLKCGSWHVVRGLIKNDGNNPLNGIGNFQEFGTTSGTLNLDGYSGYIAAMRELLIAARIYKYILDNNIETNVYDAIKDAKVAFDLY